MEKRYAIKLISMTFFVLLFLTGGILLRKIIDKKAIIEGRNSFSPIKIITPGRSGSYITLKDQHGPFIVMFFGADCYYCHLETESIINDIDNFEGVNIYMISTDEEAVLNEFIKEYGLIDHPVIRVAQVRGEEFSRTYGVRTVPSLFIYSESGVLLYSSSGFTPASVIVDIIA